MLLSLSLIETNFVGFSNANLIIKNDTADTTLQRPFI